MKKLLLLSLLVFTTLIEAKIYNGVAIVVNGEPITVAEISAVQKQLGVSKRDAKDMLIQNRLQKSAMKNISVSEDEIDKRVDLIAKQNNLSLKKMQSVVKQQGQSWNKFRDQIKISIQKQKFFRTKIAKTIQTPSDDELKIFYHNHSELFKAPSSVKVIEYSASTAGKIQSLLQNPSNSSGVKKRNITFTGANVTPQLLTMVSQTDVGQFTPAFNNGSAYIAYKVLSKGKGKMKPFDDVKNSVIIAWKKEQQSEAIDAYFKKMKSGANIEVIRK
jgi:hypothetical protein